MNKNNHLRDMKVRISEYLIDERHKNFKMAEDLSFKISHVKNMMQYKIREQYFENEIYNEFLEAVVGDKTSEEYKKNRKYLNIGNIEKEIALIPKHFKNEQGEELINYYHDLPKNMVQQIRRQLIATWKSYFKLIKKNAEEKNGQKVGLPGYSKNHRSTVIISENDFAVYYYRNYKDYIKSKRIKLKDILKMSSLERSKIRTELVIAPTKYKGNSILLEKGIYFVQEVKIIPNTDKTYLIHVNYHQEKQYFVETDELIIEKRRKHIKTKTIKDDNIIAGIDCGVRNLITMSIINKETKKVLKTYQVTKKEYKEIENLDKRLEEKQSQIDEMIEEYQEKSAEPIKEEKSHGWKSKILDHMKKDQSVYEKYQQLEEDKKQLWTKRDFVVKNTIHSISSKIAQICNKYQVRTLIFGKNEEMKQEMQGKVWNQFPHSRMMKLLQYKLEDIGSELIEQEEAYTSKSSYFELEPFEHDFPYTGIRKNEWFTRANKKKYDADVHASLNIIRKYILKIGKSYTFPVGEQNIPLSKKCFVHCSLSL